MRGAVIGLVFLATACGGPKTTDDPAAQNVIDAASKGTPAAVAAGTCAGKPDWVPIYKEAKIISCTSGDVAVTGKRSGTVIYTDFATPSSILTWSKQQAMASGLALSIEDGRSFSAAQGDARTLRVMAESGTARTNVTVNWGVKN
ncbi:hypothetical protein [Sphingomonas sp. NIBR02145]|uniref:hypothetical protein n=1 Tax=Sphingomonas sp. NIBR02145 TaxID=3014784 RepID=UPI0022B3246D|nr:hypothetical protein [Sphingomonas sp. NIBR02145]WHU01635.1 hypothetical protein O3305_15720 [Sphingomonas sp. NIBR02145]